MKIWWCEISKSKGPFLRWRVCEIFWNFNFRIGILKKKIGILKFNISEFQILISEFAFDPFQQISYILKVEVSFDLIQLKNLKKISFVYFLQSPWTVERVVGSFHRSHHSNHFGYELPCDLHDAAWRTWSLVSASACTQHCIGNTFASSSESKLWN